MFLSAPSVGQLATMWPGVRRQTCAPSAVSSNTTTDQMGDPERRSPSSTSRQLSDHHTHHNRTFTPAVSGHNAPHGAQRMGGKNTADLTCAAHDEDAPPRIVRRRSEPPNIGLIAVTSCTDSLPPLPPADSQQRAEPFWSSPSLLLVSAPPCGRPWACGATGGWRLGWCLWLHPGTK